MRDKIKRDESAIQSLGFQKRAGQYEDWVKLSATAKKEFQQKVSEAVIDVALQAAPKLLAKAGSMNPVEANRMITVLKRARISDPKLSKAIRSFSSISGKPKTAKDIAEMVKAISDYRDSVKITESAEKGAKLQAIATVLGIFQSSPQLSLLATELDVVSASLYNNTSRRISMSEVERLTKLDESDLKNLIAVSRVLHRDVSQLNEAKKELKLQDRKKSSGSQPNPRAHDSNAGSPSV